MAQTNQDNTPYFFLLNEDYIIGTPRGLDSSDKTIDLPFQVFAENHVLQSRFKLASAVFIKPDVIYANPLCGSELHQAVATYLSAFASTPTEQEQRKDYLTNNGLVRILVTNSTLLNEIKKAA